MASVLISGPAGASKSALARQILAAARLDGSLTVAADFQSIYAALALVERDPDGRYPATRSATVAHCRVRAAGDPNVGAVAREIDT